MIEINLSILIKLFLRMLNYKPWLHIYPNQVVDSHWFSSGTGKRESFSALRSMITSQGGRDEFSEGALTVEFLDECGGVPWSMTCFDSRNSSFFFMALLFDQLGAPRSTNFRSNIRPNLKSAFLATKYKKRNCPKFNRLRTFANCPFTFFTSFPD